MENSSPQVKLKFSNDGSSTLYRPDLDEHYHSIHGAVQEALHVFIKAGLQHLSQSTINVLEVGFGTGLNTYLTIACLPENVQCYYHTVEKYPIDEAVACKMNFFLHHPITHGQELFKKLHQQEWGVEQKVTPNFSLLKINEDLLRFTSKTAYNLIYFDAFAPDKQPELWTPKVFQTLFKHTAPGGLLTTYSAKGDVRRVLTSVGYEVERLQGPPGKREMLRAHKPV